MSSLWLLEAKAYSNETRTSEATSARFWLRPGLYSVGRAVGAKSIDIGIGEDKSLSRHHSTLRVPLIDEWRSGHSGVPYIEVTDCSRYGTLVAPTIDVGVEEVTTGTVTQAFDRWMIRFGHHSPFKLYNKALSLYLHPSSPPELRTAATSLGLPLIDQIAHSGEKENDAILIIPPGKSSESGFNVDAHVTCALVHGHAAISSTWITAWQDRKVWKGSYPSESDHRVQLKYVDAEGSIKDLDNTDALMGIVECQGWAGLTLLWAGGGDGTDAAAARSLMMAAERAGASIMDLSSSEAALVGRVPRDAVMVLPALSTETPIEFEGLGKTTVELVIAALVQGLSDKGAFTYAGPTKDSELCVPAPSLKPTAASAEVISRTTKTVTPTLHSLQKPSKKQIGALPLACDGVEQEHDPQGEPPVSGGTRKHKLSSRGHEDDPDAREVLSLTVRARGVSSRGKRARNNFLASAASNDFSGWKLTARMQAKDGGDQSAATAIEHPSDNQEHQEAGTNTEAVEAMKNVCFAGCVAFDTTILLDVGKMPTIGSTREEGPAGFEASRSGVNFKAFRPKMGLGGRPRVPPLVEYGLELHREQMSAKGAEFLRDEEELARRRDMEEAIFKDAGAAVPPKGRRTLAAGHKRARSRNDKY